MAVIAARVIAPETVIGSRIDLAIDDLVELAGDGRIWRRCAPAGRAGVLLGHPCRQRLQSAPGSRNGGPKARSDRPDENREAGQSADHHLRSSHAGETYANHQENINRLGLLLGFNARLGGDPAVARQTLPDDVRELLRRAGYHLE